MAAIRDFLAGRKTYLLAGALILASLLLLAAGRLTPQTALVLVLLAAFGFPATFRSALARHRQEELELLTEIAETGAAVLAHNLPGALMVGQQAAQGGAALVNECKQESEQA